MAVSSGRWAVGGGRWAVSGGQWAESRRQTFRLRISNCGIANFELRRKNLTTEDTEALAQS
jgi:hypothetical protein